MSNKFVKVVEGKNVCIVDGEEINRGYKVNEDDVVIKLIKKLKSRFSHLKNNSLYVCENHYEFYSKKRKSYERIILMVSILIVALLFAGVLFPLFSGTLRISAIISFVMITVLMSIFVVFFHVPSVGNKLMDLRKKKKEEKKNKKRKRPENKSSKKVRSKKQ